MQSDTSEMDEFAQIVNVLGKSDSSASFHLLEENFGEANQVYDAVHLKQRYYYFPKHGFDLFYQINAASFTRCSFHFATKSVVAGNCKPFAGALPFSIRLCDCEDDVVLKIGVQPYRRGDNPTSIFATTIAIFSVLPYEYYFSFNRDGITLLSVVKR